MKNLTTGTALLIALASTGAHAQTATINGIVQLDFSTTSGGSSFKLGLADFGGDVSFGATDSGLTFGIEYDAYAVAGGGLPISGSYALSAFVQSGNQRLNIGAPLSAYSRFAPETVFNTNAYLGATLLPGTSFSVSRFIQMNGDVLPLGVRYDGEFGAFSLSASVLRHTSGTIYALAGEYDMGKVQVSAGYEGVISAPGPHNAYVQVAGQVGNGRYLARISDRKFIMGAVVTELSYLHDFSDKFSAGAGYIYSASGGSIYGLNATYDFGPAYIRGSVYGAAGSTLATIGIGSEF